MKKKDNIVPHPDQICVLAFKDAFFFAAKHAERIKAIIGNMLTVDIGDPDVVVGLQTWDGVAGGQAWVVRQIGAELLENLFYEDERLRTVTDKETQSYRFMMLDDRTQTACESCDHGNRLLCEANGGYQTSIWSNEAREWCQIRKQVYFTKEARNNGVKENIAKLRAAGVWVTEALSHVMLTSMAITEDRGLVEIMGLWTKKVSEGQHRHDAIVAAEQESTLPRITGEYHRWTYKHRLNDAWSRFDFDPLRVALRVTKQALTGVEAIETKRERRLFVVNNCESGCLATPKYCGHKGYEIRDTCKVTGADVDAHWREAVDTFGHLAIASEIADNREAIGRRLEASELGEHRGNPFMITAAIDGDQFLLRRMSPGTKYGMIRRPREEVYKLLHNGGDTPGNIADMAKDRVNAVASGAFMEIVKTDGPGVRLLYWALCVLRAKALPMYDHQQIGLRLNRDEKFHRNIVLSLGLDWWVQQPPTLMPSGYVAHDVKSFTFTVGCDTLASNHGGMNHRGARIFENERPRYKVRIEIDLKHMDHGVGQLKALVDGRHENETWRHPPHLRPKG